MRVVASVWAGVALIALVCGSASAQVGKSGDLGITAVGKTGWKLSCSMQQADGKDTTKEISGKRGAVEHLTKLNISGGTCTFTGPSTGTLDLQFDTKDFTCPFPNAGPKACRRTVKAGETGQFVLSLRP